MIDEFHEKALNKLEFTIANGRLLLYFNKFKNEVFNEIAGVVSKDFNNKMPKLKFLPDASNPEITFYIGKDRKIYANFYLYKNSDHNFSFAIERDKFYHLYSVIGFGLGNYVLKYENNENIEGIDVKVLENGSKTVTTFSIRKGYYITC